MKMIKFLLAITCLLHDGEPIPLSACAPGNFRCRDGTCIAKTLFCNGNKDCPKGEDEERCTGLGLGTPAKTNATSCDYYSQFECDDGTCITKYWVCDGYRDCPYGEDERGCTTWTTSEITTTRRYTTPYPTTTATWPYRTTTTPYPTTTTERYPTTTYPTTTTARYPTTTTTYPTTTTERYPTTTTTYPTTTTTERYPTTTTTTERYPITTTTYPTTTTERYPTTTTTYPTTTSERYPTTTTTERYPTTTTTYPTTTTEQYPITTTTYPTTTTTEQYPTTTTTERYPTTTTTTTTERYPTTTTQYFTTTPPYPTPCEYPYDSLGDRCVFVDPVLRATWDEARYICGRAGGGDLAILDSMDFYSELVHYMKTNGLTRHSYWIGGRGMVYKNKWEWSSGSAVHMGTPLWALNGSSPGQYEQEPVDFYKSLENCGYLDFERFHYMDDDDCNEIKAAICQLPAWKESLPDAPAIAQDEPVQVQASDGKSPDNEATQTDGVPEESPRCDEPVQDPETLKESSQGKSRLLPAALEASPAVDPDRTALDSGSSGSSPGKAAATNRAWCDYPYDLVGGRCVVIDPVLSATWEEARYMCERTGGGDLVVLDSMDFYSGIIDYMKENGLDRHDYWVGGIGSISGRRWQWVSGSTVLDGTPLWALLGTDYDGYEQEPTYFEESLSNCGYLDRERFHFMDDADCQGLKAAICQLPTWSKGAATEKGVQEVKGPDAERAKELQEIAKSKHKQI